MIYPGDLPGPGLSLSSCLPTLPVIAVGRVFEMKMLESVADIDRVCVLERLPFLALAE
jgi:hypothetical protein